MIDYFALGDLIQILGEHPRQDQVVPIGLGRPHSYRGFYEDLAFEPQPNVTVAEMLKIAQFCLGREFQGYKGGWFKMNETSNCWIANIGSGGGDKIGELLMSYMLGSIDEVSLDYVDQSWSLDTLAKTETGKVF